MIFSERHMEYATSRAFANNQINSLGYNRTVGSGGIWDFASSYLTNGTGAIDEKGYATLLKIMKIQLILVRYKIKK